MPCRVEKLCHTCYTARHPAHPAKTITWAPECTQCHTPTPRLGTLAKVTTETN